jgi:phage FluMu protein gp41
VSTRQPELKNIERVKISTPNMASHHLRAEHFAEGMSTLQAIALAFGAIEGPTVQNQLMDLYNEKLARTLKGRGQK